MTVKGKQQRLDVLIGPNYRAVVIYAPKATAATSNAFICFEPMAGITDALNLAQKGLYKELQSIPSGQTWQESFWVRPQRILTSDLARHPIKSFDSASDCLFRRPGPVQRRSRGSHGQPMREDPAPAESAARPRDSRRRR